MKVLSGLILIFIFSLSVGVSFKSEQLKYPRVRQAYTDKESEVVEMLDNHNIKIEHLNLYLRAFKHDKILELWGKNKSDNQFQLIKKYAICASSGVIGPKRKEGDLQVPEGFYHINIFNPSSTFYLSLGINYPNKSDRILGDQHKLGGDIYIHGSCVTIGCLPITDPEIKELYIMCVEARNNGQTRIPITIFPTELTAENYAYLRTSFSNNSANLGLWQDLKKGYDLFNQNKTLPKIGFLSNGRHTVEE